MQGIVWEPESRPTDIDLSPAPTDAIVLLRERDGSDGIGMILAVGSAVVGLRPGQLVRFPVLSVGERAESRLVGFAKVPSEGSLMLRIPLAEFNARVVTSAPRN